MDIELLKYAVSTKKIQYNNIWLISDIHAGVRSNSIEWIENIENYFYNFYIPYIKEHKEENDILCLLGDLMDSRQSIDIHVLNSVINIISQLSNILPIHLIIGNHDCGRKYDTSMNSAVLLKYIPNVFIYEKPIILTNDNSKILLLPWIGNKKEEENYIQGNSVDYVFAHADISGFKYDNGRDINRGIDINAFKNTKRVFSGHIHKRQELNKLIYIGSPYHTKRSDIGNNKGFYIFNPQKNKYKFIENTISSKFQKIKLDNILEWKLQDVKSILENNYTDIIVPDKYIHLFNLTKFIDFLGECKYKKIETVGEKIKVEDNNNILSGESITDSLTLLEKHISELKLEAEETNKLKELNKKYYNNALSLNIEIV